MKPGLIKRIGETKQRLLKKYWLKRFINSDNLIDEIEKYDGPRVPMRMFMPSHTGIQAINTTKEDIKVILDSMPDGIEPQLIVEGKLMKAYDVDGKRHLLSRQDGIKIVYRDGIPLIIVDDVEEWNG